MKLVGLTAEQVDAKRLADLEVLVRAERDRIMKDIVDTYNAARWEEMNDFEKAEVQLYRRQLMDIPQQPGFPKDVIWPPLPAKEKRNES